MITQINVRQDWFVDRAGLPRPDWNRIDESVREFGGDADGAYHVVTREWLTRLGTSLENGLRVVESPHFQLLSGDSPMSAGETLAHLENARSVAVRILGDLHWKGGFGKHVFMRFRNTADYKTYISDFVSSDRLDMSSGMCLQNDYVHVVWPANIDALTDKAVMAHELFHNLVSHLRIPAWLNEGLAMLLEVATTGLGGHSKDGMLIDDHRQWWTQARLQSFWDGRAFFDLYSQELAYSLARLMMTALREKAAPTPDAFRRFVLTADQGDAGAKAFKNVFGIAIGELAAQILGPGNWDPICTNISLPTDYTPEPNARWTSPMSNDNLFADLKTFKISKPTASGWWSNEDARKQSKDNTPWPAPSFPATFHP